MLPSSSLTTTISSLVQAVETRLVTTHCMENLCSGQGTVAPHSGQEASIDQAIIPALYPPATNQPEARRLNQNSEENVAQVEKTVEINMNLT